MSTMFGMTAVAVMAALLLLIALGARPLAAWMMRREAARAMKLFKLQREKLEAQFFQLASTRGKPRGLRWLDCDWRDEVAFGREKTSRLVTAFVGVNIRFEAIEGGDMEEVEAVGMVRDASAVFHFRHGQWGTGGRALFNMNPATAVSNLGTQLEAIDAGPEKGAPGVSRGV